MREVVSGWWTPLPEARRGALPVASGRLDRRTALLFMPKCNADWGEDWHVLGGRRMEGKLQSSKRVVRKRRWPHRRAAPAELAADLHTLIRVRSRRLLTGPGCALVERRSGTSRRGAAASRRSPGAWGRGWARRGAGAPPGGGARPARGSPTLYPGPCVSGFPAQLVAGGPAFLDLLGWRRRGLFVSLLIVMPREEGGKKMSP